MGDHDGDPRDHDGRNERKKRDRLEELEQRSEAEKAQEMLNAGEVLLSFFAGRRRSLTSVASRRKAVSRVNTKVASTEGDIEALEAELADLAEEIEEKTASIRGEELRALEEIEEREVRLEKSDITVKDLAMLWIPVTSRLPSP